MIYQDILPVKFKQVYTSNVHVLDVNPEWTCAEFIVYLTPLLNARFNYNNSVEIVALNPYAYENIAPEEAPAFVPHTNIRIKDKWFPDELRELTFYVRELIEEPVCGVCLEAGPLDTWFGCTHQFCEGCYANCLHFNHTNCPICRQNLTLTGWSYESQHTLVHTTNITVNPPLTYVDVNRLSLS